MPDKKSIYWRLVKEVLQPDDHKMRTCSFHGEAFGHFPCIVFGWGIFWETVPSQ